VSDDAVPKQQTFQESQTMSFFSWLSGAPGTPKSGSHLAQGRGPAGLDVSPHKEDTKTHRHARREQLYLAIREAMTRSGVLSSRYKFKVLSLDQRGDTFLVMVDLSQQEGAQTEVLPEIEKKIMVQAMARFDIAVSAVYWRLGGSAFDKHPKPEFQKTLEADERDDGKTREPPVYKTIEFDELAAFREARLSAAKREYPAPAPSPEGKPRKPEPRKTSVQADFEDTELVDGTPLPGLSTTQYGDLN
jgi:hypothetical protein